MLIPRTSKNFLKRARKYAYYQYVLATRIEFEIPTEAEGKTIWL
ncbi:hypothetical protein SAMN02910384_02108 [Pseudobutyrivibrio sp. ACV-2]|nr:hypothetical protein SAMN02910384_02108 [Pseudobutyrivibrio sp. ACV-2]